MKYRIAFLLHAKGGKDVQYLECRLKWDSCRRIVALSMGYQVNPDRWSMEAQRCMPNSFHGKAKVPAAEINAEIERYVEAAREVFSSADNPERGEISRQMRVKLGRYDGRDAPGVLQAFRLFIAEQSALCGWAPSTVTRMNVVYRHVEDYGRLRRFTDVDKSKLAGYLEFLRDDLGLSDVTASRQIGYLRWFLRWAADEKGWLTSPDWRSFRPKFKPSAKPVIFLTWDELMAVWSFHDPKREWLDEVRDIFCFCAFTSLRYSDAQALRWSDVGEDAISVTTQKTQDALIIELNKWSREILSRYDREDAPMRVFAQMTNQVMNRALKTICEECGIDDPVRVTTYKGGERTDVVKKKWELIGTHAGRRTFVVNALQMGIGPTTVMQWTGHKDYNSMKPYIAVADAARAKAMKGFDKLSKKNTRSHE